MTAGTGNFANLLVDATADSVVAEFVGHSTQTNAFLRIRNDANTRTYLDFRGEQTAAGDANYFKNWNSGTSGFMSGMRQRFIAAPSANTSADYWNLFEVSMDSSTRNFTGNIAALIGQTEWNSTGTHTTGVVQGVLGKVLSSSNTYGAITTAVGVNAAFQLDSNVTTAIGFNADQEAGSGTFTNSYGLWVESRTKGSTFSVGARIDSPGGAGSKYTLWLAGDTDTTTANHGIVWGTSRDTNLYRSGTDALKTDDRLEVGSIVFISPPGIFGYNSFFSQGQTTSVGFAVRAIASATVEPFRVENSSNTPRMGADVDALAWDQNTCRFWGGAITTSTVTTGMLAHGMTGAGPVASGTGSNGSNAFGRFVKYEAASGSGNVAGVIAPSGVTRRQWYPEFTCRMALDDTAITSYRVWVGLTSADLSAKAAPTTESVAAFRYDTGVDGTAFWRCITHDAGATPTVTTTSVGTAVNGTYNLRITIDDAAGRVRFWINDALVATHTTALPVAATTLLWQAAATNLAAGITRNIRINNIGVYTN